MFPKPVKCHICDEEVDDLPRHLKRVHPKSRVKECTNCGKKVTLNNCYRHLYLCQSDGSRPFKCTEKDCNATFKTLNDRWNHISFVHSEPFECPFPKCGSLLKKGSLPSHVKRVHDKWKQECSKCGKQFTYNNMFRHLRLCGNDGSRPFECTEKGCDATFRVAEDVRIHIDRVHCERVKCRFPGCDTKFKKLHLALHMKTVHERPKKKCENCGKILAYLSFANHSERCKSTKKSSRPFRCLEPGCKTSFKTEATRSIHVANVHARVEKKSRKRRNVNK